MPSRCHHPLPALAGSLALAIFALAAGLLAARVASATGFSWIGTSGSAGTASNWSPNGIPQPTDYAIFSSAAGGNVSWPANVDSLDRLYISAGSYGFQPASRLGLASVFTLGPGQLYLSSGKMASPRWLCAASGSSYSFIVVQGAGVEADATAALGTTSFDGSSLNYCDLTLQSGGSFISNGALLFGSAHAARAFIGGVSGVSAPTLATLNAGPFGQGTMTFGDQGISQIHVYDGGRLLSAGDVTMGRSAAGSGSLLFTSTGLQQATTCVIRGQTYVGANDVAGSPGGGGFLQFDNGTATLAGTCWVGDPDDSPSAGRKSTLQSFDGHLILGNGLITSPARTGAVLLDGGLTQVIGGPLTIRQSGPFYVGGILGTNPQLWLENHTVNDVTAPDTSTHALEVGREVYAILRASGAGTVLNVNGNSAVFDLPGGGGEVAVDSGAVANFDGSLVMSNQSGSVYASGSGSALNVTGLVTIGAPSGAGSGALVVDSLATAVLSGGVVLEGPGYPGLVAYRGATMTVHGLTIGGSGYLTAGFGSETQISVTGHLDIGGNGSAYIDTAGVLNYAGASQPLVVGIPGADGSAPATIWTSQGGRVIASSEVDVRGLLYFAAGTGATLVSHGPPLSRLARPQQVEDGGSLAQYGPPGLLQSPLTRILGSGSVRGFGTIRGRFHMESPTTLLIVPPYYYEFAGPWGRMVAGDSTATDGFVSHGQSNLGPDTLLVLDQDGGDLGRMSLEDGVLQLPKPGHLNAGDLLSGTGRIEGGLDVRHGGRAAFLGTVKGSVTVAGELGEGAQSGMLSILGGLQIQPDGRVTIRIGGSTQELIAVSGTAALGGALDVRAIGGNLPVPGDTLTLLTAGSITGSFSTVTFNGGPTAGVMQLIVGPSSVRVAIVGAIAGVDDGAPPTAIRALAFAASGGPRDAALVLDLPAAAHAEVALFDVSGRRLAVLAQADLAAGRHRYALGRDEVPASGMYFARALIQSDEKPRVLTARVVVLR